MGCKSSTELSQYNFTLLGDPGSGKTSILERAKKGTSGTIPDLPQESIGARIEKLKIRHLTFSVLDMSKGWDQWNFRNGVIFVIDSSEPAKLQSSKKLLMEALKMGHFEKDAPLLIFSNKSDKDKALSDDEVADALGLNNLAGRRWKVASCSAKTGDGVIRGLEWLVQGK